MHKKEVVVDYVILKEPRTEVLIEKSPEVTVLETPKVEIEKKIETGPEKKETESQKSIESRRDYVSYYQLMREKMRRCLKENYGERSNEGDIHLIFMLDPDGRLLKYEIDMVKSVDDKVLSDITVRSLKEASPFPPFPKGLPKRALSFDVTVSFKKK